LKLLECLVRKLRLLLGKGSGTQAKRERENSESVKGKMGREKRRREKWQSYSVAPDWKNGAGKNGDRGRVNKSQ
jgi:hypothetical protein